MTCERIEPLLYLKDEEQTPTEQKMVSEHLKTCDSCRELDEKIKESRKIIGEISEVKIPVDVPGLTDRVISQIRKNQNSKGESQSEIHLSKTILLIRTVLTAAAVFFFVLYSAHYFIEAGKKSKETKMIPVAANLSSREKVLETLAREIPPETENYEDWIKKLTAANTYNVPLEKVIVQKYSKRILQNSRISR